MNAKISLLLLSKHLQDPPSSGSALKRGVCQSLSENRVDDLLSEQQFAALGVLNDAGNDRRGRRTRLWVGAFEVVDDGENLALSEGGQFRI